VLEAVSVVGSPLVGDNGSWRESAHGRP